MAGRRTTLTGGLPVVPPRATSPQPPSSPLHTGRPTTTVTGATGGGVKESSSAARLQTPAPITPTVTRNSSGAQQQPPRSPLGASPRSSITAKDGFANALAAAASSAGGQASSRVNAAAGGDTSSRPSTNTAAGAVSPPPKKPAKQAAASRRPLGAPVGKQGKPMDMRMILEEVLHSEECESAVQTALSTIINRSTKLLFEHDLMKRAQQLTAIQSIENIVSTVEWQLAERDQGEVRADWHAISAAAQRAGKTIIGEPHIISYEQRWHCEDEPTPCIIDRWARGVVPAQRKEFLGATGSIPPMTSGGSLLPPVTTASMLATSAHGLAGTSSDFPVIFSATAASPGPLARSMTFTSGAAASASVSTMMSATTQSLPPATSLINQTSSGLCDGVAFPDATTTHDDQQDGDDANGPFLAPLAPADSQLFWSRVGIDGHGRPTLPLPVPPPDIDTRPRAMKPSRTTIRTVAAATLSTGGLTASTRDLPAADQKAANAAVEIVDIVREKTESEEELDRMRESELRKMEKKRKAKQKAAEEKQRAVDEEARLEKIQQELRGKNYTFDARGNVIIVNPLKPERMPALASTAKIGVVDGLGVNEEEEAEKAKKNRRRKPLLHATVTVATNADGDDNNNEDGEAKEQSPARGSGVQSRSFIGRQNKVVKKKKKVQPDALVDVAILQPSLLQTLNPVPGVKLRQGAASKVARKDAPTTLLAGATIRAGNGLAGQQLQPAIVTDPNDARILTRTQYNSMLDTKGPTPGGMARTMQVVASEPKLQPEVKQRTAAIVASATLGAPSSNTAAAPLSATGGASPLPSDDIHLAAVGSDVTAPESFTSNFFARKMAARQSTVASSSLPAKKAATFSPNKARSLAEAEHRRINHESERLNQAILAGHDPTWGLPLGDSATGGFSQPRQGPQGLALPSRATATPVNATFEKKGIAKGPRDRFARTDARVTAAATAGTSGGVILPAAAGALPRTHLPAPPIGATTGHGLYGNTTPRGSATAALDDSYERSVSSPPRRQPFSKTGKVSAVQPTSHAQFFFKSDTASAHGGGGDHATDEKGDDE